MPVVDLAESDLHLRERIDEMATRLLLNSAGMDPAADLAHLRELAISNGRGKTARVAASLAENARAAALDGGLDVETALETLLRKGIPQLQETLEAEAREADQTGGHTPPAPSTAVNPLAQDPELVADFILESREHLAAIERGMLVLEQTPADVETIHSVFRAFHTIKGLAGFLEFTMIQELSHEVETLLGHAREGQLAITPAVVDVVLESADHLKLAVSAAESSLAGGEPAYIGSHAHLLLRMRAIMSADAPQSGPHAPEPEITDAGPTAADPEVALPEPPRAGAGPRELAGAGRQGRTADAFSVRVDTRKLDYLMDMVGEMVIAQSIIRHSPAMANARDSRILGDLSQLARITNEVQRTAMSMRMIPVGQLFQRIARLVRDLSRKEGKTVDLVTSGEETELDKTIAEELADPLLHMVRNAIDHGIETPAVRSQLSKNPTAIVRLAAYHQGGQIVVEISDDGRGLDRAKILARACQNGLIHDGAQLSEAETFQLIFEPGFSTADKVTDISGRGVGMDVVRKHVQRLRGRIDIQSKPGRGTTFYLKLPLTLAIIDGLVVTVGSERYIIPIFAVREMFRPAAEALSTVQGRGEMALVRGRLLPVLRLYRRFGVRPRTEDPCQGLLVVAECEGRQFCVLVDDLVGKQEVVIKSLGEGLKDIAGIAGCAILGDGRVGLILEMEGVFRGAGGEYGNSSPRG